MDLSWNYPGMELNRSKSVKKKNEPFGKTLILLKSSLNPTKSEWVLETARSIYYQTKNYNETSEILNENEK